MHSAGDKTMERVAADGSKEWTHFLKTCPSSFASTLKSPRSTYATDYAVLDGLKCMPATSLKVCWLNKIPPGG
jgi:hypothetical protein